MKKFRLTFFLLVLVLFGSEITHADNSYLFNFQNPKTYIASLENLRKGVGQRMSNFNVLEDRAVVYSLNTTTSSDGILVGLSNIEEDAGLSDLQLVVSPRDLYLSGFVYDNVFFRFPDAMYLTVPGVSRVVEITSESSYTALTRVAEQSRSEMRISRVGLSNSLISLTDFARSNSGLERAALTRPAARAILQFITVTSEAARFREIQRDFRRAFFNYQDYALSSSSLMLTLNWASVSEQAAAYSDRNENIIGNGYTLNGVVGVVSALALLMNCNSNSGVVKRDIAAEGVGSPQCTSGNVLKIEGGIFTMDAILIGAGLI